MKKWEILTLSSGLLFCVFVYYTIITELKQVGKEIEESLLLEGKLQKINWKWTYLPIHLNIDQEIKDQTEILDAINYLNQESSVRMGTKLFEISSSKTNSAFITNKVESYNNDPENLAGTVEKGLFERPTIFLFNSFFKSKVKKLIMIHELLHLIGFDHNMKEESIMFYYYSKKQNQKLTELDWDILKFVYTKEFVSTKNIPK